MGEFAKEVAKVGVLALLFNPTMLLILLIIGLILLVAGIAVIIYYGLVTAIAFFVLTTIGVLALHYFKAIDLTKQPWVAAMPFIMAILGYIGERIRLFAIQPLWVTSEQITSTVDSRLFLALAVLLILVVAVTRRK